MSSSVSTTVKTVLGDQKKKDETGKVSATAKTSEDNITK